MITASVLTKNLQLHWLQGAHGSGRRWSMQTMANNTLGWQWVAAAALDAAPYYRIFNPVLQAKRFDPLRGYIRHWVPELARLPDPMDPSTVGRAGRCLQQAGVEFDKTYPRPVVDLGNPASARFRFIPNWR